jgi:integrase
MANEKAARVSRLFLSTVEFNGKPVSSLKKGFRSAVRLAGLPGKVTPHTLRHIGCDLAMLRGVPICRRVPWMR